MHRPHRVRLVSILACLAALSGAAAARAEVDVRLTAHRVTTDARGQETTAPAEQAKPGDLVEYRAVYHNEGNASVQKLVATLPIPAGMEYVPRTAAPAVVTASLDGKTFAPVPLTRKVRLENGREVVREVPAGEYRFLRWSVGALEARQKHTVRARVRVTPLLSAAPAAR